MHLEILLVLATLAISTRAVTLYEVSNEEWELWKLTHGKNYSSSVEEGLRMKVYLENKLKIARHNREATTGQHSYFVKMNHFGDLLHHEFVARMNGYKPELRKLKSSNGIQHDWSKGATFISPEHVQVPESVDWRSKGAVTDVKDQGQCGSCWAFSTTGSLEGQHFRKSGKLVSLSEQNLVDCSTAYGNNGCGGGLMDNAFRYIKDNGGIDTERSYPYEGDEERCHYSRVSKGASDVGFVDVPQGDEVKLKEAVATVGPVSVAIDASQESFQFYSHGVYSDSKCDPSELDHGVLVVGYGVDERSGENYWIVKNSWSPNWGDDGYIKMQRDNDNMCGIASAASYPLV